MCSNTCVENQIVLGVCVNDSIMTSLCLMFLLILIFLISFNNPLGKETSKGVQMGFSSFEKVKHYSAQKQEIDKINLTENTTAKSTTML